MSGHIKIRDLELVVALHEEGNLTQAAERVGITEPAFSKRLRTIERRVKAKLFARGPGGTVVTDSGRFFVERVQISIQSYYQGVHDAQEAKYGERHKLRIGASAFLSPHLIELLHSTELRLYRNLTREITTAYSCEILQQLQHHQVDLALITSPPPSASITSVRVTTEPFIIMVRPRHPLAAKSAVRLSEVATFPWVFFNRHVHPPLHDLILQRMEVERLKPNIVHQVSQSDQAAALLTDNTLLAWFTPAGAERVVREDLLRIPLVDEHIHLEIHLATLVSNESRLVSEFVRSFMRRIEEERSPTQMELPIA
ncbi:MAG: LysR family transcriptional regulator [Acidobacteriaceae bacterium]